MRLSLKRTGKKERSRSRQAGSRIGKYLSGCRITWKDVGITLGILFVATIAAFLYDRLTAQTMNVIMFSLIVWQFLNATMSPSITPDPKTSGFCICVVSA